MPFIETYTWLEDIAEESSTNKKEELLAEALKNPVFEKVCRYALSMGWTYNINNLRTDVSEEMFVEADDVFRFLDYLREKGSANDEDKARLSSLAICRPENFDVVERIIKKDLRCGVSFRTINKVKKGTCFSVPYQRCSTESKIQNVSFPAIAQKKADSMFSYGLPFRETGQWLTRGGIYFNISSKWLMKEMDQITRREPMVTIGELQVLKENGRDIMSRKQGNGILNSIIQGTGTQEQMDSVVYDVWDIIPYEDWMEEIYKVHIIKRFKDLLARAEESDNDLVQVIPYKFVNNLDEARAFYKLMRSKGYEGAILKNFNDFWKNGTSTKQIKLKNESIAEFILVDAYYGDKGKKYEHMLGGITVESACGGIRSNCGSGFSDKEREKGVEWWLEQKGKIVSIKFESVIDDKTARDTKKLYTPRFDEIRHDKHEADTMEYCIDISTGGK